MKDVAELISALVPLAWPLLAAVVLWRLFPIVRDIAHRRAFTVEAAGMKVSVQEATEQLNTRIADVQQQVIALRGADAGVLEGVAAAPPAERSRARTILWVDDNPEGNALELAQLEKLGIQVLQSTSTADALKRADGRSDVRAIVSDMGRQEGVTYHRHAGLALLRGLREAGIAAPFLVYTTARSLEENRRAVIEAGGDGATASSTELLEWLQKALV